VTRYTEGFSHFVTSMTAPVASGWSGWPGGACTHWKAPPCHGAHVKRSFRASAMSALSAALIGVQYPYKESQFLTEGSR
jgi:hypothetical protein